MLQKERESRESSALQRSKEINAIYQFVRSLSAQNNNMFKKERNPKDISKFILYKKLRNKNIFVK